MNKIEGNTLNVPELRRLLAEAEKAEEFCRAVYNLEVPDPGGNAWSDWRATTARVEAALHKAGPALLDAAEERDLLRNIRYVVTEERDEARTALIRLKRAMAAARRLQVTTVPMEVEDDEDPAEWLVVDPTTYEEFREALREFDKAGPS